MPSNGDLETLAGCAFLAAAVRGCVRWGQGAWKRSWGEGLKSCLGSFKGSRSRVFDSTERTRVTTRSGEGTDHQSLSIRGQGH